MKRQTMMSWVPNRPSDRSAHALDGGPESSAEQVAEVVAEEGADGRAGHQQGDARVAAP
jgi:hypothetical protein